MAGALEAGVYRQILNQAGFESIDIEPTRVYGADDARAMLDAAGINDDGVAAQLDGAIMSAFIRGIKPARSN